MFKIGDKVKPSCTRCCNDLGVGEIVATRDNDFYHLQVQWPGKETASWYNHRGLELVKSNAPKAAQEK